MTLLKIQNSIIKFLNKIKQNLFNVHCDCMKIVVGRCHTLCYVPLLYKPMMRPNNRYQVANFCLLRDFIQKIFKVLNIYYEWSKVYSKKNIVKTWKLTNILLNQISIKMNMQTHTTKKNMQKISWKTMIMKSRGKIKFSPLCFHVYTSK